MNASMPSPLPPAISVSAYLEIETGPEQGRTLEVPEDGSIGIGRVEGNDLVLADRRVSRRHCRIEHDGAHYWLIDCDSRNGTVLNGRTVRRSLLYDGDVVEVGQTELTVHLPE